MILKLSEKEIKKTIDLIGRIYERFSTIKQYWIEGDTDSDGYTNCREGLDLLIDDNEKLHKALNIILDMADTLKDNDLLDK